MLTGHLFSILPLFLSSVVLLLSAAKISAGNSPSSEDCERCSQLTELDERIQCRHLQCPHHSRIDDDLKKWIDVNHYGGRRSNGMDSACIRVNCAGQKRRNFLKCVSICTQGQLRKRKLMLNSLQELPSKKNMDKKWSTDLAFDKKWATDLGYKKKWATDLGYNKRWSTDLGFKKRWATDLGYNKRWSTDLGFKKRTPERR